jgi:2-polyprenyl-3-methyl-5-hydroxy-6-metoxy-1,4-benzoquinol methylase
MSERDEQFWDKVAKKYAASPIEDQLAFEKTVERTRGLLSSDLRVLELGCGTGTLALRLTESVNSYLATDLSKNMIAIAQKKLESDSRNIKPTSLEFRQGTVDTLLCESARYDIVLAFSYLHLLGKPSIDLANIRSLITPGGLFISKTPCIGEMNPLVSLFIPIMRFVGKTPRTVTSYTSCSLEKIMTDAGFEILVNERHSTHKSDFRPFIVARAK